MIGLDTLVALVMMIALTLYVLLGGADYGGGMWDLLARGPRAEKQRELIAHAIGPVWEANHVWLILVVVLLFAAFPPAFALISIALHVPITLMLIGIVLRGSAFTFRAYDSKHDRIQRRWSRAFAIPSLITPILLGVIVGVISSDVLRRVPSGVISVMGPGYILVWGRAFPFAVGIFAVVLFAFLAAVYLTSETDDPALQDDFRIRAITSEMAAGALALVVFLTAENAAPGLHDHLARSWWTWPVQIITALIAITTLWLLWTRRFRTARITAAAQVAMILWGWGFAQYPYLVRPELTIHENAAPEATLRLLLMALAAGALLLFPSYWYLFRVFKTSAQR
jgi:cytochrome bd ubiquinol oxidase subunit II